MSHSCALDVSQHWNRNNPNLRIPVAEVVVMDLDTDLGTMGIQYDLSREPRGGLFLGTRLSGGSLESLKIRLHHKQ